MSMPELESVVAFLDDLLEVRGHPDYRTALNGLQVAGPERIGHVASAVDASVATIDRARDIGADLMVVHHGAFWGGLQPLVGRQLARVGTLIRNGIALYSAHLPLDAHPEVGNCAILIREIGLEPEGRFGEFEGVSLGFRAPAGDLPLAELADRVRRAVGGGPVRVIEGAGPGSGDVAVVTGGGGSFIPAAAAAGVRTLVTGEGSHHTFVDAHELGVNVIYAGHYATETFGVRALGDRLREAFGIEHSFIDVPSGL
jgi:dinuclear metal center YbgI/SA1388 family protein